MDADNKQELDIINLLNRLQTLYEDFLNKAKNDLSIILLIGITGAGKSTIFNFLSGAEFEFQEDDINGEELQVKKFNDYFSEIKGGMISITKEPKYHYDEQFNHLLIDFPGFQDTRGSLEQLMIQLLFYKIVTTIPTKVVYVVRHPETNFCDRGVSLQDFIRQQFADQQLEQWKLSLLLNSYNEKLSNEQLKVKVQKQLEEIYEKANENIFVFRKINDPNLLQSQLSPEMKNTLWEQLIQSNIIKFVPKTLPKSEIISEYLKETSNLTIAQYCFELNKILAAKLDDFSCDNIQDLQMSIETLVQILEKNKILDFAEWYSLFIQSCNNIAKLLGLNYQNKKDCQNFIKIFKYFAQFSDFIDGYSECEKAGLIADSFCQQMIQFIQIKLKQLEDFQIAQERINQQKELLALEEEKRKQAEKLLQQQLNNNQLNEAERIRLQKQFEQVQLENQKNTQNFQNQIQQLQQNARREVEELNRANQNHLNQLQLKITEINSSKSKLSQVEQELNNLRKEMEKKQWVENRARQYILQYVNMATLMEHVRQAEKDYQNEKGQALCQIF